MNEVAEVSAEDDARAKERKPWKDGVRVTQKDATEKVLSRVNFIGMKPCS